MIGSIMNVKHNSNCNQHRQMILNCYNINLHELAFIILIIKAENRNQN